MKDVQVREFVNFQNLLHDKPVGKSNIKNGNINDWLKENRNKIIVHDIKYSISETEDSQTSGALVIYSIMERREDN